MNTPVAKLCPTEKGAQPPIIWKTAREIQQGVGKRARAGQSSAQMLVAKIRYVTLRPD
ncbi:MAG: hypothetical protein ACREC8_02795 [Limisphaerales bacterium]